MPVLRRGKDVTEDLGEKQLVRMATRWEKVRTKCNIVHRTCDDVGLFQVWPRSDGRGEFLVYTWGAKAQKPQLNGSTLVLLVYFCYITPSTLWKCRWHGRGMPHPGLRPGRVARPNEAPFFDRFC